MSKMYGPSGPGLTRRDRITTRGKVRVETRRKRRLRLTGSYQTRTRGRSAAFGKSMKSARKHVRGQRVAMRRSGDFLKSLK